MGTKAAEAYFSVQLKSAVLEALDEIHIAEGHVHCWKPTKSSALDYKMRILELLHHCAHHVLAELDFGNDSDAQLQIDMLEEMHEVITNLSDMNDGIVGNLTSDRRSGRMGKMLLALVERTENKLDELIGR